MVARKPDVVKTLSEALKLTDGLSPKMRELSKLLGDACLGLAIPGKRSPLKVAPSPEEPMDILTFVKQELGIDLYPVQKFVLKLFYGIPLGTDVFAVPLKWDSTKRKSMSEREYYKYLLDSGRVNRWSPNGRNGGIGYSELILSAGRRSGKDVLCECIAAYETYKLVLKDVRGYYGHGGAIALFGPLMDQARFMAEWFGSLQGALKCDALRSSLLQLRHTECSFADAAKFPFTVRVCSVHADVRYLRGTQVPIMVVINEAAHCGKIGWSDLYKRQFGEIRVAPGARGSFGCYQSCTGAPVENKALVVSSPCPGSDFDAMYYDHWFNDGTLCLQIPTWEINPTIPASEYRKQYKRSGKETFDLEFGAKVTKPKAKKVW